MNLILRGRGVDLNDRLRGYATEKFTRCERYFERIIKMEVEFRHEPNPRVEHPDRVEVTVKTPGDTLRAHGAASDHFAAVDQAAHRLETQLRRFKERLRDHHRGDVPPVPPPPSAPTEDVEPSSNGLVRVRQPAGKPMTPDEAILELETRDLQFLLFTNAESMEAGVVYRRQDGGFGLVEYDR